MKLKYNFIVNQVADKMVAVPVGNDLENFNGFIKMNDIGAYIFNMLKKDVTEDEIIASLEKEYEGVTKQELLNTVKKFIVRLKESDVIE